MAETAKKAPLVGVIMGSSSDWETLQHAAAALEELGVPHEVKVVSAHRTPDLMFEYASSAESRGLEVIGTVMRTRSLDERRPLVREFTERMLPLFDQRVEHAAPLRPVLERTFAMTELADAHRLLEANETFGKVVVRWDG